MADTRAEKWRGLLPRTIRVRGRLLRLVGPADLRWIVFNGQIDGDPAERFAYARNDYFPGERPGLWVWAGLRSGNRPTKAEASATVEMARLSLEAYLDENPRG